MEKLLFRKQFILTNSNSDPIPGWKTMQLLFKTDNVNLHFHPDLQILSSKKKNEILIGGYIIDPFNPKLTDQDIIDKLADLNNFNEIVESIETMNGRYFIIYINNGSVKVFNDVTGSKEIYYHKNKEHFYLGSTPNIISHYTQIKKDDDKQINEFYDSAELKQRDNKWIGERTIFKEVMHLLPNHVLDINSFKAERFWPYKPIEKRSLKESAKFMGDILKGTYQAVVNRYDKINQSLTSGWETRMMLAASKDFTDKIHYYVCDVTHSSGANFDVEIASKLAKEHNLDFEVVNPDEREADEDFKKVFYQNHIFARQRLLNEFYNVIQNGQEDIVTMSGSMGNQLLRVFMRTRRNIISGERIAMNSNLGYGRYQYVIDSINDWISKSKDDIEKYGYNVLDLFSWEQFCGHWGPLSAVEQDITNKEDIRIVNNRSFISTYMGLKDKDRYPDYPLGHEEVIRYLWPELLKFPSIPSGIKYFRIKKILRAVKLEQFAEKIYRIFKE